MDRRLAWRLASWTMLVLTGTALAGCAALDLLGGHLPGEEEAPPPLADPQPYPGARRMVAERPQKPQIASETSSLDAPAPIVSASAASKTPAKSASQPAARASLSDDARGATLPTPQQLAAQPAPAAPASDARPEQALADPPASPAPAASLPAQTETDASKPPAVATPSGGERKTDEQSAKAEPTAQERLADVLLRRDELVAALEGEVKLRSGKPDVDGELPRLQQQLRLLYLLAERPDDAVGEIESLPEAEQEAFKQLMFGLGTWLSPEEDRRPTLRNARVLRSLKDAAGQLAAAAKLDVRNLRFCESVEGFGWYKEFPAAQFRPKQQVILYAEVDNFTTEKKSADTYETELQVSYQIFDAGGTLVNERQLPLDKEVCRTQRRDYFLVYRIYLPESIAAGRYRLELTVEDLKAKEHYQGRKLGDGMIEFSIRQ